MQKGRHFLVELSHHNQFKERVTWTLPRFPIWPV